MALGKSSAGLLRTVYQNLGAKSTRVLTGPGIGLDNAVVSVGGRRVLIMTTDPVSMIPSLGPELSSRLSVNLIASDYTTSGQQPKYAAFEFNFPTETDDAQRKSYLTGIGSACRELGVSIVSGHTGSYPGAGFTVIGGGTMLGFGTKGNYIDASMSRPGDAIIMTKGVAIEAAAYLANTFSNYLTRRIGKSLTKKAKSLIFSCTTVRDARAASTIGLGAKGLTSMHDATEGGILGGLEEMATASGNTMIVDESKMLVPAEVRAVCDVFEIDPLRSLSEGTLLLTCMDSRAGELVEKLRKSGIAASRLGRVGRGKGARVKGIPARGREASHVDPYWAAYAKGIDSGLN